MCSFFVPMSAKAEGVARAGYVNGFNDQFTANTGNWVPLYGSSWSYSRRGSVIIGKGQTKQWTGILFSKAQYANFEYEVKMKRIGCDTCTNQLFIRSSKVGIIYYGYTNSGFFTIYSCNSVSCTTWQSFKASDIIVKFGSNTLKVLAVNNDYKFYINKRVVYSRTVTGPLTLIKTGYVGVDFYSTSAVWHSLDVDFAILVKK